MTSRPNLDQVLSVLEEKGSSALESLARNEPVPIVRDREILFLYNDRRAAVRSIHLVHHVSGLPHSPRFERVGRNGLYLLHMVLPRGARLEYTFRVSYRGGGDAIHPDPLNPRSALCPFGPTSVVETEDYRAPSWAVFDPETPRGTLLDFSIESRNTKDTRRFTVYAPAAAPPPGGYPILLVHDGGDYRDYAEFIPSLDNLIAQQTIAPLLTVLTHPHDRNHEYSCTPGHAAYLAEELLPWVRERFPIARNRRRTGLMGASFGAVASIHTAYRYPGLFQPVLLQSGSFFFHHAISIHSRFRPVDEFDRIRLFLESEYFPPGPSHKMKFFLSCGTFESILPHNRTFVHMMEQAGHAIRYRESHDGHNWISWRDHFGEALAYLFPVRSEQHGHHDD